MLITIREESLCSCCAPADGLGSGEALGTLLSFFDNVQFMLRFFRRENTNSVRLSERQ